MRFDAVILAAGEGKRLRPLTNAIPKPLAFLPGGTVLDHELQLLAALGAARVVVVLGHLGEKVEEHLRALGPRAFGRQVELVPLRQRGPEGLLYALEDALSVARSPLMVLHGDNFLGGTLDSFGELLSRGWNGIAVAPEPRDRPPATKDTVSVDPRGEILAFGERQAGSNTGRSFGCYSLGAEAAALVKEVAFRKLPDCDMIPVFREILEGGGSVRAIPWKAPNLNLNTEADLLRASEVILEEWGSLEHPRPEEGLHVPAGEARPLGDSRLQGPAWVSPRAELESSELGPYVAVGAGAHLKEVRASRALIFPGAMLEGESAEGRVVY